MLFPATADAQYATRTLPMDRDAAERFLDNRANWSWLTKEHPHAAIDFSSPHTFRVVADDGTIGTVTLAHQDAQLATAHCTASILVANPARQSAEALNLCDQVAAETMPRAERLPGYWWQVVLFDLALGPAYPFSGALVHLAHRRPKTALASIGIRFGAIGTGIGIGSAISLAMPPLNFSSVGRLGPPPPNYFPQLLAGLLIGGASGIVAATLFDAIYLARPRYGVPGVWQF